MFSEKYSKPDTGVLAYVPIKKFSEVLEHPPFNVSSDAALSDAPVHVVCDYDGVVSHPFKRGSLSEGLETFHEVAKRADALTIWTARKVPDERGVVWSQGLQKVFESDRNRRNGGLSRFPFLSNTSMDALTAIANEANPDLEVNFIKGDNKFRAGGTFVPFAQGLLEDGRNLAIVGSSVFERKGVNKLVKQLGETGNNHLIKRINFFDTQGLII